MGGQSLASVVAQIRDRFPVSAAASHAGVKLVRAGREWKGCCPFHPDRSPSFTIYADDRRFQCFGCAAAGDVLDFVQRAYSVGLRAAIDMLDHGALAKLESALPPARPRRDLRAVAAGIVQRSLPIADTPAERYLRRRGINIPLPHTLRFARLAPPKEPSDNGLLLANGPGNLPCLVANVTDTAGAILGIQRTYLTEAGCKAASADGKVKYSLGNVLGGAIQLAPARERLLMTEGLEDGLTLMQRYGLPVWVAAGTAMLPRMKLPDVARSIVIGADGDDAGIAAATKAANVFQGAGRTARIMPPPTGYKDFNAALLGRAA